MEGTPLAHAVASGDGSQAQAVHRQKQQEKEQQAQTTLWQHPFVDVLKHFKMLPGSDWKLNKKQGDVAEYFAKEIGRRAISVEGTISANNFVQLPHPNATIKNLGLTGRYIYFQVKCTRHGLPFSYHVDLGLAERSHGVRISVSNLFRKFDTQNGFVAQIPLELKNNCWTVLVIDIYEILRQSKILPPTYLIDGSYQVRQITVCANTHLRGIYTSDNMYDFVTLPADMRFKFAFDLARWPEYFDWQSLPHDWSSNKGKDENKQLELMAQKKQPTQQEQREQMRHEIDQMIHGNDKHESTVSEIIDKDEIKRQKYEAMQNALNMQFNKGPGDHPVTGFIGNEEGSNFRSSDYKAGQFSGQEVSKSHKLSKDPIMELKHIIGYQPSKCLNLKWSRQEGENVVIFTTGGTLIAMDTEQNEQKRFFFGHSAPISCFDLNNSGTLIASAQEGNNSIIRIWDYFTARSIAFTLMPVQTVKCLTFSHDGKYLAGCGKDSHSRELIVVYDISKIARGEKPEIVAKQTSEFNILSLKFSPIDSTKLASCGKENIRFWRIKEQGNIRGSAVVLNHHARDTVFTCLDFEYGFKSADKNENESLKRIFVGTKNGMVFQVNYQSEVLEATYKTNDRAIFSISVNEAFCVTGSEDTFLRVWPLDFQEFFMEAQHEGTVNAVDISPDGLKVACGTMWGSIGILDKSNQSYKTLMRAHTNSILALDYHRQKEQIISISTDRTIRLWSTDTFSEVYEFSSAVDQPLCVSTHPHLPIFSCGFESGKMRVFNIDSTEVLEEFSQFNRPLKALSYDNTGQLLVTCCSDGSVSIHNAARAHLPVKMLHLEQAPEFTYICFSERVPSDPTCKEQKFALMGESGNNINIYDTGAFMIQHQIVVNNIITRFKFSNGNQDLMVVTKDCKVRFYSLYKFEGIFLREISSCHRGSICSLAVSANSGYFLTGGQDNMVKIWDYDAQKSHPYFFQSFIGHSYQVNDVLFNPRNNQQIITVGELDGIYVWEFNGDVDVEFQQAHLAGMDLPGEDAPDGHKQEPQLSMLERIRTTNKAKKAFRNQMSDDSFIIPEFKDVKADVHVSDETDFYESPVFVSQKRQDMGVSCNHYANCAPKLESPDAGQKPFGKKGLNIANPKDPKSSIILESKLINGYDGFGGVHDNLVWNVQAGITIYTLMNKLIVENTKSREQQVYTDAQTQLSCIAVSDDFKLVAFAEGSPSQGGTAKIFIYNLEAKSKVSTIPFHSKGVQTIAFTHDKKFLVSCGVQDDAIVCLWDIDQGLVVSSVHIDSTINQVKVDPHVDTGHLQFFTVGNSGSLIQWRCDYSVGKLHYLEIVPTEDMKENNFTSLSFTSRLPQPVDTYYVLIGSDNGILYTYNQRENRWDNLGKATQENCFDNEFTITGISVKANSVVCCTDTGFIAKYAIVGSNVYPDRYSFECFNVFGSAIVSMSFDELNNEGLIGTENGCIWFVVFGAGETPPIKLVQSNNNFYEGINMIQFDTQNPALFLTSTGKKCDELKLLAKQNCDQICMFSNNYEKDGHVVFVISQNKYQSTRSQHRLIGFSNGVIKRVNLYNLKVDSTVLKFQMWPEEKITCGFMSENDSNFVMGTSYGNIIFASIKQNKGKSFMATYCRIENLCKQVISGLDKKPSELNIDIEFDPDNDISSNGNLNQLSQSDFDKVSQNEEQESNFIGITNIHFLSVDPIGTMLVSFDDGMFKVWKCVSLNEQYMKIMSLQQKSKSEKAAVHYDISKVGYQQFDLLDSFDIYENPEKLNAEDLGPEQMNRMKELYRGKKKHQCFGYFYPGNSKFRDQYICFTENLQYLYVRNYLKHEPVREIPLQHFPTCLKIIPAEKIKFKNDDAALKKNGFAVKDNWVYLVGTQEGKMLVYMQKGITPLKATYQSKAGVSYGAITSLDIKFDISEIICGTQAGEVIQFDLEKKLNEE